MVLLEAPLVYVVILHWHKYLETQRCIDAVRSAGYRNIRIVVVDNHSADGSAETLTHQNSDVKVLSNDDNLGFARGCNVGMRYAFQEQANFILLLNNDIEVVPGFLDAAIEAAQSDMTVGLVTGKILYKKPANVIWHAGGYVDPIKGQGITRGFLEVDHGQYDQPCETKWATGAMMLISRAVIDKIGYLPDEYFFGVEEWDYSTAVRRAGFKIQYEPRFISHHESGASYKAGHPVLIVYNGSRNKQIYQEKYLGYPLFLLWRAFYGFYVYFWWPRRANWGCSDHSDYIARIKAARYALKDHRRGKRVELADLERIARLLGPTKTWGIQWFDASSSAPTD